MHRSSLLGLTSPALTLTTSCSKAQETSLLPADTLQAFALSGRDTNKCRITPITTNQPDFQTALRAQTLEPIPQPYYAQLTAKTNAPIHKNDVLLAKFWARTVESPMGEGFLGFTFEQSTAPFTSSMGVENSVGTKWQLFSYPFKAVQDFAPGEAAMNLRLGYATQTLEIGGISLTNYGTKTNLEDLPSTSPSYEGSEPNAPWRKEAEERIEKIRKATFDITVTDARGHPIPNAKVKIEQTSQAFGFGSAINAKALISEAPADKIYTAKVKELFNKVVFENDLKWGPWENDRDSPQQALRILRDANIETRGHVLVWPSWRHSPSSLEKLKADPTALQKRITDHIADEVGTLRGQLPEWDVLNEPYSNHDIIDLLGPQSQVEWFQQAHQADPNAKLYLNDYSILEGGGRDIEHQKHFEDTIAYLLDHKAPLQGIGIQGHFGWNLTSPPKMLGILDRYAKFKLPIQITEFDVQITDSKLQAAFTRDFLTAMFSYPSVNGVVMWGFWEGRHYAPSAALWRKDWTPKPNGQVWLDLVQKEWRTNTEVQTNGQGQVTQRAFLGDYKISVTAAGQTITQTSKLKTAGETQKVQFKLPEN